MTAEGMEDLGWAIGFGPIISCSSYKAMQRMRQRLRGWEEEGWVCKR